MSQRSIVTARSLGREEPVRIATPVGTLDDGTIALVDPAGMVQLTGRNWVLDWWIGAEDGWHFASSDTTVAQNLIGYSPIVRTTMHVPGGDIIQRVVGVRASASIATERSGQRNWSGAAVVVEVENQSAVPVALAFVMRPLTLWGDGELTELRSQGSTITADGHVAAVLSRGISRRVVGPPGTVAIRLDLEDDEQPEGTWSVEGQLAEGAFIVPLPHTAVVRVLLPVETDAQLDLALTDPDEPDISWQAPTAEQVEAGWRALTRSNVTVASPETLFDDLVDATQRFLQILRHDGFYDSAAGCSAALRNALLSEVLVTCGVDEALEPLARALADADRVRGGIRMDDRSDASVALLHSAAPLLCGSRSEYWQDILLGPVAKAVHRLGRGKALGERETGGDPLLVAALTNSAALAAARLAPALLHIEQPEVAEAAHELYHRLAAQVLSLAGDGGSAAPGIPAGPAGSTIPRSLLIERLIAQRAPEAIPELAKFAVLGHLSLLPAELDADGLPVGEPAADSAATASRLRAVVGMFVGESPASIEILPFWSDLWFGKPIEVNNVRTRLGAVSFALRWSENRPILLWEVEPGVGVDRDLVQPIITTPGLDPTWHGHGWTGEALLGAVEISAATADAIAERDRPKVTVSLGRKKGGERA